MSAPSNFSNNSVGVPAAILVSTLSTKAPCCKSTRCMNRIARYFHSSGKFLQPYMLHDLKSVDTIIPESEHIADSIITWKKDYVSSYVRSEILSCAFPIFIELQNLLFKSTTHSSQITSLSWDLGVKCLPQSIQIFVPLILFLTPFRTGC